MGANHGLLVLLSIVLVSGSWSNASAQSCDSAFKKAGLLSEPSLKARGTKYDIGPILVNGYSVTNDGRSLSTFRVDAPEGARLIDRINTEPTFVSSNLVKISDSEFMITYQREYESLHLGDPRSIQIFKVLSDGKIVGQQKIEAPSGSRDFHEFGNPDSNTLVAVSHDGLNSGQTLYVYRRQADGKFKETNRLKKMTVGRPQASPVEPGVVLVKMDYSYFHPETAILRIPPEGRAEISLRAGKINRHEGLDHSAEPADIFPLTSRLKARGLRSYDAQSVNGFEVFAAEPNGSWKSLGNFSLEKRDVIRGVRRYVSEVNDRTFVVLDDHSYATGVIGSNLTFARYVQDVDISIVTATDSGLKAQTLKYQANNAVNTPDAVRLSLNPIGDREILLTGAYRVQVVRKTGQKWNLEEVARFKRFDEEPLKGDRIEVVQISPTRFVVQDQFVIERLSPDYRSQIHVFDLIDGKYVNTGSKLLDGRRFDSINVLEDGRVLMDVRPEGSRKTPNPQILDLDKVVQKTR